MRQGGRINRPNGHGRAPSERTRQTRAELLAREYVPRGAEQHTAMAALLVRIANALRDNRGRSETYRKLAMRTTLMASAVYAYFPDGPPTRERRTFNHERMQEAAAMIARRGSDAHLCINLQRVTSNGINRCSGRRVSSRYCLVCQNDETVQLDDKRRQRAIEDFWDRVMSSAFVLPEEEIIGACSRT